jgi:Uma2 family endonuclease
MSATPQTTITPEQYLELDRAAEFRSEYFDGCMYAMSGGTHVHALLIASLTAMLYGGLRKQKCSITASDMRLRVWPVGLYTYPDVMVLCGQAQYAQGGTDTLINPTLIIEVLSPSTEAYDRGFKFHQYQLIESLQEYALVSQKEPRVEIFRRQSGGDWLLSDAKGLDAKCRFTSVTCEIELSAIYENITFDPDGLAPPPRDSSPR